jgi:hypothetical protein
MLMIQHGMHESDLQLSGEDVSRAGTTDKSKVVREFLHKVQYIRYINIERLAIYINGARIGMLKYTNYARFPTFAASAPSPPSHIPVFAFNSPIF